MQCQALKARQLTLQAAQPVAASTQRLPAVQALHGSSRHLFTCRRELGRQPWRRGVAAAAASPTAAPPPPQPQPEQGAAPPPARAPDADVARELEHLAIEVAAAVLLPPAEEGALLEAELGGPPLDTLLRVDEAALPQPLVVLRCKPEGYEADPDVDPTTFYVLGTAHISAESCADVRRLIRAVRPQFVFLELCKERALMLEPAEARAPEPTLGEALAAMRAGRATPFSAVYAWLLARMGRHLELPAGEEFRVALKTAQEVGAKYVLGDRPITITMGRMWAALSAWDKARLVGSLLLMGMSKPDKVAMRAEIEHLKQTDALSAAIDEFAKDYPAAMQPLVTERDLFMVYVMRKLATYGTKVVCIVGAGHLKGIKEHWEDTIDLEDLLRKPDK